MRNNTVAILDLGSSKIVCLIAKINSTSGLEIIGIGYNMAVGIHCGFITDFKKAEESIISAVNAAEKMANVTVDAISVNISGLKVYSKIIDVVTNLEGKTITNNTLFNIIKPEIPETKEENEQLIKQNKEDRENFVIIHALPINFSIDGYGNIEDPIGMSGNILTTKLHLIGAHKTLVRNIETFFSNNGISKVNFISSALASAYACLNEDEKNLGSLLIDIGASQSDIIIFENSSPKLISNIQMGASIITRDIAKCLNLTVEKAERIKILYGEAVFSSHNSSHDYITITQEDEALAEQDVVIKKAILVNIISARIEEIIEVVFEQIKGTYPNISSIPKVVITGGGSFTSGFKEIIKHTYGKSCRIAKPKIIEGISDSMKTQIFSSSIGLLLFEYERTVQKSGNKKQGRAERSGNLKKILSWVKSNTQ